MLLTDVTADSQASYLLHHRLTSYLFVMSLGWSFIFLCTSILSSTMSLGSALLVLHLQVRIVRHVSACPTVSVLCAYHLHRS